MQALLLTCLLAVGCLAQTPYRCKSPPLLSGSVMVSSQNEALWESANFIYDAIDQRIRLQEFGVLNNKSFSLDALLLYREGAMFFIDKKNRNCTKRALKGDFQPLQVPQDAQLLGQAVLGSSSGPGEGLLVNTWVGNSPETGKYMSTVTEFGCIPIGTAYHSDQYGWLQVSYYNNIKGVADPSMLNPPEFCKGAELERGQTPVNFLNLFF
ncbi:unnamed protein product [Arctogadus glacialis]